MSPFASTDLTEMIAPDGDAFIVLRSLGGAEHEPEHLEVGLYRTRREAKRRLRLPLPIP